MWGDKVLLLDEITRYTDAVVDAALSTGLPIKQIILFGSYARGEQHKESDLDIYIVFGSTLKKRTNAVLNRVRYAVTDTFEARGLAFPVDILGETQSTFTKCLENKTSFESSAVKDGGIILYDV